MALSKKHAKDVSELIELICTACKMQAKGEQSAEWARTEAAARRLLETRHKIPQRAI